MRGDKGGVAISIVRQRRKEEGKEEKEKRKRIGEVGADE